MKPKIDVIFHRDPDLEGIDLCRVVNSSHCFPKHFHDDLYVIGLIASGTCNCLEVEKREAIAGPGGLTLFNPGQIHSGVPVDQTRLSYSVCHISVEAMTSLAQDLDLCIDTPPEFTTTILNDPIITALFKNLFRTLAHSRDCLEKEALLVSAFHLLLSRYGCRLRSAPDRSRRHQTITQARSLLSRELNQKLTLEEVARSVGLSRYHFLRTFKRETGLSPHMYRTLNRVEAARKLLLNGLPAARVALETGFTDQSHFANTFRRYFGATPKQYLAATG